MTKEHSIKDGFKLPEEPRNNMGNKEKGGGGGGGGKGGFGIGSLANPFERQSLLGFQARPPVPPGLMGLGRGGGGGYGPPGFGGPPGGFGGGGPGFGGGGPGFGGGFGGFRDRENIEEFAREHDLPVIRHGMQVAEMVEAAIKASGPADPAIRRMIDNDQMAQQVRRKVVREAVVWQCN